MKETIITDCIGCTDCIYRLSMEFDELVNTEAMQKVNLEQLSTVWHQKKSFQIDKCSDIYPVKEFF